MKNAAHHQGLSEQQVQENRTRYGVNILTPPEKEPQRITKIAGIPEISCELGVGGRKTG